MVANWLLLFLYSDENPFGIFGETKAPLTKGAIVKTIRVINIGTPSPYYVSWCNII